MRTETQEAFSVQKRLTTKSLTEKQTATFADNDVVMPVEIKDSYLLKHVEHTPQRRDWCGNESLE